MMQAQALTNLTDRATVLSPDRGHVVTFDRNGRLVYYFRCGETFKRGLGSDLHLRFRQDDRKRRRLTDPEALHIFSETLELARRHAQSTTGEAKRRLEEEILVWSPEELLGERERFESTYQSISILPPDKYRAIVVQVTEGCSWNRCTFCNFYMNRPFRVRSVAEVESHTKAVRHLLGEGIRLREGIFLADGNALAMSNRRLNPLLDRVAEVFPGHDLFGFVDLYSGEKRNRAEWKHLYDRGLRRVYIGMETGLDELLALVNKPGSAGELEGFVEELKAAGLEVSLIVMMGLGGVEFRDRHRKATRDLLLRLGLERQDLVYLSPFVEHLDSEYGRRRKEAGLTPMSEAEVESEISGLAKDLRSDGLRVSRYDIREFIY